MAERRALGINKKATLCGGFFVLIFGRLQYFCSTPIFEKGRLYENRYISDCYLARPRRFERPTPAFGGQYSIQLSYGRAGAAILQSAPVRVQSIDAATVQSKKVRADSKRWA